MKISKKQRVVANEEFDKYEDEIKEISQEFTSENTSINFNKVPAVFNLVRNWKPGTINLDYGGGRTETAVEYLAKLDVMNLVYDPYNRSAEHNSEVIRLIREAGGADTATCSNVLNVIKEPEVRNNVLQNIKKLVKPGGEVYITVYEGTGRGDEGPTKAGYQLNRKTADYLDEIREVFPDAQRKGKLIVAHNTTSVRSSRIVINSAQRDPHTPIQRDFIETPGFTKMWEALELDDDDLRNLQIDISARLRQAGDVIPETKGARKIRIPLENGKRSGGRVIYVDFVCIGSIYLLMVFPKSVMTDIDSQDKKQINNMISTIEKEIERRENRKNK